MQRPRPGDPFAPSAHDQCRLADLVEGSSGAPPFRNGERVGPGILKALNNTGAALEAYRPAYFQNFAADELTTLGGPNIVGPPPTLLLAPIDSDFEPILRSQWVITQEPIPDGEIGDVQYHGPTWAWFRLNFPYNVASTGGAAGIYLPDINAGALIPATDGPFELLKADYSNTSTDQLVYGRLGTHPRRPRITAIHAIDTIAHPASLTIDWPPVGSGYAPSVMAININELTTNYPSDARVGIFRVGWYKVSFSVNYRLNSPATNETHGLTVSLYNTGTTDPILTAHGMIRQPANRQTIAMPAAGVFLDSTDVYLVSSASPGSAALELTGAQLLLEWIY